MLSNKKEPNLTMLTAKYNALMKKVKIHDVEDLDKIQEETWALWQQLKNPNMIVTIPHPANKKGILFLPLDLSHCKSDSEKIHRVQEEILKLSAESDNNDKSIQSARDQQKLVQQLLDQEKQSRSIDEEERVILENEISELAKVYAALEVKLDNLKKPNEELYEAVEKARANFAGPIQMQVPVVSKDESVFAGQAFFKVTSKNREVLDVKLKRDKLRLSIQGIEGFISTAQYTEQYLTAKLNAINEPTAEISAALHELEIQQAKNSELSRLHAAQASKKQLIENLTIQRDNAKAAVDASAQKNNLLDDEVHASADKIEKLQAQIELQTKSLESEKKTNQVLSERIQDKTNKRVQFATDIATLNEQISHVKTPAPTQAPLTQLKDEPYYVADWKKALQSNLPDSDIVDWMFNSFKSRYKGNCLLTNFIRELASYPLMRISVLESFSSLFSKNAFERYLTVGIEPAARRAFTRAIVNDALENLRNRPGLFISNKDKQVAHSIFHSMLDMITFFKPVFEKNQPEKAQFYKDISDVMNQESLGIIDALELTITIKNQAHKK